MNDQAMDDDEYELMVEAYGYGYGTAGEPVTGMDIDGWDDMDDDERCEAVAVNFDDFTSTARYANFVLPRLREMAGFTDPNGAGTYTEGGEAEMSVLEDLIEAFSIGFSDAKLGADLDPERVL